VEWPRGGAVSDIEVDNSIQRGTAQGEKIQCFASVASMVRLAGIGPARATAIAAYRDSFGEKDGQGGAFRDCSDLQKVYGIGPKTAESMSEWLRFE